MLNKKDELLKSCISNKMSQMNFDGCDIYNGPILAVTNVQRIQMY